MGLDGVFFGSVIFLCIMLRTYN